MTNDSLQTVTPMRWVRTAVFKLRQEDFASVAGVSRPAVSRYETETDNPPYPVLRRIRAEAQRLGLEFSGDWFFAVPSPAALPDAQTSEPLADADTGERACGDHAVVAALSGDASHDAAQGEAGERFAGGSSVGLAQFGRVEVGDADLNPTVALDAGRRLNAEAVAIADVPHGSAEDATSGEFGGHGAAIRNTGAGIGKDRPRQDEGEEEDCQAHGQTLEDGNAVREAAQ